MKTGGVWQSSCFFQADIKGPHGLLEKANTQTKAKSQPAAPEETQEHQVKHIFF